MKAQQTIGIVGGGQLGRMLTLAALPLGFGVVVVDPNPDCPAAQVGALQITADLYNAQALHKLAELADYITVEIEHVDVKTLLAISRLGKPVNPAAETIQRIQDKYIQKKFLSDGGVAVAPFQEISDNASAQRALQDYGGRMLIKTRHGAYDGRGNMVVDSADDITRALEQFAGKQLYAEAFVPFEKELAVMVARGVSGEIALYPIAETVHERNICTEVRVPAAVPEAASQQAAAVVRTVAELLSGAGTFGVELFLDQHGTVLVNEIAPRVHNSGHYTIEACATSQFEQCIRAISGLPLGSTDLLVPSAVMVNILGERNGEVELHGLAEALAVPYTSVHLYGKSPTKVDRKMGHITATGQTVEEARERARSARSKLSI
jgi:5-(carboxyamino)imidazole ribonucleotide synthase